MQSPRFHHLVFLAALFALSAMACGTARPQVKVLGVTDTSQAQLDDERTLLVFIEVVNPTRVEMKLSRLDYQLRAQQWFDADGHVDLSRSVRADSTAVIEVPVRLGADALRQAVDGSGAVTYSLQGRLVAMTDRIERSWKINVEGMLTADAVANARRAPIVRIADVDE